MSNNNTGKESKRLKMANEGVLNEQYTLNKWFVKVKPAYQIDRVCFSFVEKGKKGSGFDVYIDMDTFANWMEDVKSFSMHQIIENEKSQGKKYPDYYKFTTGTNACKTVGIGVSTANNAFATINGSFVSNGTTIYANVPVDYNWLRTLARWFLLTSEEWFRKTASVIVSSSETYRSSLTDADTDSSTPVCGKNDARSYAQQNTETIQPEPSTSGPAIKVKGLELQDYFDSCSGLILDEGGNLKMQVLDKDAKLLNLVIPKKTVDLIGANAVQNFSRACEQSYKNKNHVHFQIRYKHGTYSGIASLICIDLVA